MKQLTEDQLAKLAEVRSRAHDTNRDLDNAMLLVSAKGSMNKESVKAFNRSYEAHHSALAEFKALVGHEMIGPQ